MSGEDWRKGLCGASVPCGGRSSDHAQCWITFRFPADVSIMHNAEAHILPWEISLSHYSKIRRRRFAKERLAWNDKNVPAWPKNISVYSDTDPYSNPALTSLNLNFSPVCKLTPALNLERNCWTLTKWCCRRWCDVFQPILLFLTLCLGNPFLPHLKNC